MDEPVKTADTDEELIDVLTAISVVSMKLARKLTMLAGQSKKKGEYGYEDKHFERTRRKFD